MEMALDLTGPGDLLSIGETLLRIKDFHKILFIDFDNTNIRLLRRFPGRGLCFAGNYRVQQSNS